MSHQVYILGTRLTPCPTCKSKGFNESLLGPDRCAFCDGTEGGNPPTVDDLAFELASMRAKLAALRRQLEEQRVVVPELTEDILEWLADDLEFDVPDRPEWDETHDAAARVTYKWLVSKIRHLSPGEVVVGREEWIRVEDRLPEDGQNVGFITDSKGNEFYHRRVYGGRFRRSDWDMGFGGFNTHGLGSVASHWFPFPTIPDALRSGEAGKGGGVMHPAHSAGGA